MGNKFSKQDTLKEKQQKLSIILRIWSNYCIKNIEDIILTYANFVFNSKEWKHITCNSNTIMCHYWGYYFYLKNISNENRIIIKTFEKKKRSKLKGINPKIAYNNEYNILSQISHKNVVHLLCKYSDKNNYYIIYECFGGQNLVDIVADKNINIDESLCKYFVKDMLNVYKYLDSMGIYHSGLQISSYVFKYNFDYNYNNSLLLTNFDNCIIIKDYNKKYRRINNNRSKEYIAPELHVHNKSTKIKGIYIKTGDIFSIGVIIYGILFKILPKQIHKGLKWHKPISAECQDFLAKILEQNYKKRMNIHDAFTHEWLQ